jgi:hypothetical protein
MTTGKFWKTTGKQNSGILILTAGYERDQGASGPGSFADVVSSLGSIQKKIGR